MGRQLEGAVNTAVIDLTRCSKKIRQSQKTHPCQYQWYLPMAVFTNGIDRDNLTLPHVNADDPIGFLGQCNTYSGLKTTFLYSSTA